MDKKKQIERIQLDEFVSNKDLKLLVYNIKNMETPDFVVNIDEKIISIEHTKLINPELQKIENYKDKIIKKAQKRFEEKYSHQLYTLITFRNILLKSGKIEEEKYIEEVYNLIEQIYLKNRKFEFRISSYGDGEKVSSTIESFSVDNTRHFSHWQHFGAYLVKYIDMKKLQDIVIKKENNIEKYPEKYDENWLLLVSDFGTEASANRTDLIDFSVIKSKFDKIYIYNYRADEIQIVK